MFDPNHIIVVVDPVGSISAIPVELSDDGVCYATEAESDDCAKSDWHYDDEDGLTFQGQAPLGPSWILERPINSDTASEYHGGVPDDIIEAAKKADLALTTQCKACGEHVSESQFREGYSCCCGGTDCGKSWCAICAAVSYGENERMEGEPP